MATWRNDFSSLCIAFCIFSVSQCVCQLIKHYNLILSTYTLNFLITQPILKCTHIQSQAAQDQYESLIIDTGGVMEIAYIATDRENTTQEARTHQVNKVKRFFIIIENSWECLLLESITRISIQILYIYGHFKDYAIW